MVAMFVKLPCELNSIHISVAVRTTGSGKATIREETENNFDTAAMLLLLPRTDAHFSKVYFHTACTTSQLYRKVR